MPDSNAGDLQFEVALVAPEPRHLVVRGNSFPGDAGRDLARLVDTVLHQFETHPASGKPGREIGAIADRRNYRNAGLQQVVDDNPVIGREPGIAGEFGIRHDPDADQDKISWQYPAVVGFDPSGAPAVAKNAGDTGAERDRRPPGAVRFGKETRSLRRDHAAHRLMGDLDDMHRSTGANRDRGEFETDKTGADDYDFARLLQALAQNVGIDQGAQWQHTIEFGARHRQRAASRTRRQHNVIALDARRPRQVARPCPGRSIAVAVSPVKRSISCF